VAPLIFRTYRELYVGLLACCLFVLLADSGSSLGRGLRRWVWVGLILAAGVAAMLVPSDRGGAYKSAVVNCRNFFGVLTVWEVDPALPAHHMHVLQHGTTFHGLQFVDPAKRLEPTTYYGRNGGGGLTLESFPRQENRRIGVVGLGIGTLAAYGREGDYIRFYEINPQVKRLAERHFVYLASCPADVDVVLGDARLSMENEPPQQFDVLLLDAFTSNAVPVHLLTKEAFETYLGHLKDDGVIAVHVSSSHLKLDAVVLRLAEHLGLQSVWIEDYEDEQKGTFASDWILLTNNEEFLDSETIIRAASLPDEDLSGTDLWTDDYVNLLQVLE
jgi:hypothetical protein